MFRVIILNGENRNVRLATEPDGAPVVVDDFGCSWHVAEFDVEFVPAPAEPVDLVVDPEPVKPVKRERKPKPPVTAEPEVAPEPAVESEPETIQDPKFEPVVE